MISLRIGLLWHTLGHGNLGVDALSRANIAIIRAAAVRVGVQPRFILMGTPGPYPPDEPDVEQGPRLRLKHVALGRSDYLKALDACDVVFDTSEGDSFTDMYGAFRFLLQSGTKWAALRGGKPLVLSPQTIGPFRQAWTRVIAARLMKRARLIFARDELSTKALVTLSVTERTDEIIDVAFRLPFKRPERSADEPLRVGVNVSGLLFNAGDRFQLTVDYPALVRRFLTALQARPHTETWLVPHVLAEGAVDDDSAVSQMLKKEFPTARLAPRFRSSMEAKSFIAGMDVFTGARMHACIAAFSAGVPVVPVAYSRKFNGLFSTLGYRRMVDGRATDTDAAFDMLLRVVDEREVVAREIIPGLAEAMRRLQHYEDMLTDLLKEVRDNQSLNRW